MKAIFNFFSGTEIRIVTGMGAVKCVRAVLTIAAVMLAAGYFGASLERDAWVLGCSAVTMLTLAFFGPLNETFRIKYLHILAAEGEMRAQQSVAALLKWVVVISCGLALVVGIYPNLLMSLLAPGFSGAQHVFVARVLSSYFPVLIFMELIVLFSSVLNAYRSYYLPEFFAIASVALSIMAMVFTAKYIGIFSLILAAYCSQVLLLCVLIYALRRRQIRLWSGGFASWGTVKPYFWFGMPLYVCYLTGQFHAVIERRVCTILGEGSVSILDYGRKFLELPTSILMGVVGSVVAPMLVRQLSEGSQFIASVLKFINLFYLGLIPFCALLIVFPGELVELLLIHGAFKPEYGPATAETVRWFGVGALGLPLYVVCGQALMASNQRRLYVVSVTSGLLVSSAINMVAYHKWGVVTMAMSWSLLAIISGGIMMAGLPNMRKKNLIQLSPSFIFAAALIAVNLIIHSLRDSLHRTLPASWSPSLVELALAGGLALMGLAFYFPHYRRWNRTL